MGSIRIELLADHLDAIETLARWHCEEDGRGGDHACLAFWREALLQEAQRDGVPTAFVALEGVHAVGAVSLVEHNMDTRRDIAPWVAGTFVRSSRRGEGIGTLLMRHVARHAATLGLARLYLFTEHARPFYEHLGWRHLEDDDYEGARVSIMTLDLR